MDPTSTSESANQPTVSSIGGHPVLDFTNTATWDEDGTLLTDSWSGYASLLDWIDSARLVSGGEGRALREMAYAEPDLAELAIEQARQVRRCLRTIFAGFAADGLPSAAALGGFNAFLKDMTLRISTKTGDVGWDWQVESESLEGVLRPVLWDAAQLMLSDEIPRVRLCDGERCGWLFIDRSRRGNRRWCDMRDCGNRAKARRHYYRHRAV